MDKNAPSLHLIYSGVDAKAHSWSKHTSSTESTPSRGTFYTVKQHYARIGTFALEFPLQLQSVHAHYGQMYLCIY